MWIIMILCLLFCKVVYVEEEKNVLYVMATTEEQRDDWMHAIQSGQ